MKDYFKKEGFSGQKSYVMPSDILKKVLNHPLCRDLYVTDIGYYPDAHFHNRERKKGCSQFILIYCIKGSGWYQVKDERFILKPNQMAILPQYITHKYGADLENPWTIYWVHFTGKNALALVNHLQKNNLHAPASIPLSAERTFLFQQLITCMEAAGNIDHLVDAFLTFPYYLLSFRQTIPRNKIASKDSNPVEKSIIFMKNQLASSLTLKLLANNVSLSPSHYSSLFKMEMHNSPMNYFIFLKMQYACQLLANTAIPVKNIAAELGYTDPFHFSRAFTKAIGISPRGFRLR